MITNPRSKHSKSPKFTKLEDRNKRRFIEHYNNKRNVLFCGNDFYNSRREVIKNIWLDCGGVDQEMEYYLELVSKPPINSTSKSELVENFQNEWLGKYKRIDTLSHEGNSYEEELDEYIAVRTHITDKTWRCIDCEGWSGKKVYEELVTSISDADNHKLYNGRRPFLEGIMHQGYLFACKGLIFLDNLRYNLADQEDDIYYRKLIKIIKERIGIFHRYMFIPDNHLPEGYNPPNAFRKHESGIGAAHAIAVSTSFNWIVAYTRNPDDFPLYFKSEFSVSFLPSLKIKEEGKVGNRQTNVKLKRGGKKHYVPEDELIPFIKQDLKFLKSPDGGELIGAALARKIMKDIKTRFGVNYKESYVKKLISEIETGKKEKNV